MELLDKIRKYIDDHENEMVEELMELCAIDSVCGEPKPGAPFGPGPKKALDKAGEICEKYGLETKNYDNRVCTADFGGSEPALDVIAHVDVVPAGEGWVVTRPFSPMVRDGRVYGRGTADDKCGVIVTVYAMRALKELGIPVTKRCRLITGSAEETGMEDLPVYYAAEKPAPMSITPDADYPVINIEKGRVAATYEAAFSRSEGEKKLLFLDGGIAVNQVPATAYAQVTGLTVPEIRLAAETVEAKTGVSFVLQEDAGTVRITATGRAAHASTPEKGKNSVLALAELVLALPLDPCEGLAILQKYMKYYPFGDITGTAAGIAAKDDVSGDTTCSADIIKMTETLFHAETDARTAVCADSLDYPGILSKNAADMGTVVTIDSYPSHIVSGDSHFVRTLNKAYEDVTGLKGGCVAIGGSSYVHHVEGGVAFGCLPEGDPASIHGPNESMSIDWLKKTAVIYALVIAELCN